MKSAIVILPILSAVLLGCGANDRPDGASSQVASSSSSTAACQATGGEVFADCLASAWQVAVYDDVEQETFFTGEAALPNTFFQTIDLDDGDYGNVIDIEYFQITGFSSFQLYPSVTQSGSADDFTTVDLSAYENGVLSFDLRILDYGMSELGLYVTLQCGWPCRSRYFPVANQSGFNTIGLGEFPLLVDDAEWRHLEIPLSYFMADNGDPSAPNLDITAVNTIVFAPAWASDTELQGFHFQIDNIEFKP